MSESTIFLHRGAMLFAHAHGLLPEYVFRRCIHGGHHPHRAPLLAALLLHTLNVPVLLDRCRGCEDARDEDVLLHRFDSVKVVLWGSSCGGDGTTHVVDLVAGFGGMLERQWQLLGLLVANEEWRVCGDLVRMPEWMLRSELFTCTSPTERFPAEDNGVVLAVHPGHDEEERDEVVDVPLRCVVTGMVINTQCAIEFPCAHAVVVCLASAAAVALENAGDDGDVGFSEEQCPPRCPLCATALSPVPTLDSDSKDVDVDVDIFLQLLRPLQRAWWPDVMVRSLTGSSDAVARLARPSVPPVITPRTGRESSTDDVQLLVEVLTWARSKASGNGACLYFAT